MRIDAVQRRQQTDDVVARLVVNRILQISESCQSLQPRTTNDHDETKRLPACVDDARATFSLARRDERQSGSDCERERESCFDIGFLCLIADSQRSASLMAAAAAAAAAAGGMRAACSRRSCSSVLGADRLLRQRAAVRAASVANSRPAAASRSPSIKETRSAVFVWSRFSFQSRFRLGPSFTQRCRRMSSVSATPRNRGSLFVYYL